MLPDEIQDILFAESLSAVAVAVLLARAFQSIMEPVALNPPLNLVVIFAEAKFKITDCVAFGGGKDRFTS